MDLFLGVDGTGDSNDDVYATNFENSHVRRIWREWHSANKKYVRGPNMDGETTGRLAIEIYEQTVRWYREAEELHARNAPAFTQPTRVFLSGYSRGGAAVIEVAYRLNEVNIPVHALLLFDAVDRTRTISHADVIPQNVLYCRHARRDPAAGSRESFGNCGLRTNVGVDSAFKYFYCTHGAMGGTPWKKVGRSGKIEEMSNGQKAGAIILGGPLLYPAANTHDYTNVTLDQENKGSADVWDWMSNHLRIARAMPAPIIVTAKRGG